MFRYRSSQIASALAAPVWHARDRLDESFLLLNGDSWLDVVLVDLAFDLAADPARIGALALRPLADAARYGVVSVENDLVRQFYSRPIGPDPGLVNGGVYALRRIILDDFFIDISVAESYAQAQDSVPAHRLGTDARCPTGLGGGAPLDQHRRNV